MQVHNLVNYESHLENLFQFKNEGGSNMWELLHLMAGDMRKL